MKTKHSLGWSVVLTVALSIGLGLTFISKAQAANEATAKSSCTSYLGQQLATEFQKFTR